MLRGAADILVFAAQALMVLSAVAGVVALAVAVILVSTDHDPDVWP